MVIDAPVRQLDRPFTYRVPPQMAGKVTVGSVVLVPLQSRLHIGYVIGFSEPPGRISIKDIEALVDEPPAFEREMVELCEWISRRYFSTFSQALRLVIPPGRVRRVEEYVSLVLDPAEALARMPERSARKRDVIRVLHRAGGEMSLAELRGSLAGRIPRSLLKEMERAGLISIKHVIPRPKASGISVKMAELTPEGLEALDSAGKFRMTPARRRLLLKLREQGGLMNVADLQRLSGASFSVLKACREAGLVRILEAEKLRDPFVRRIFPPHEKHVLNAHQEAALREIMAGLERGGGVYLLQGVTGSGKTEVYLHAIEHAIGRGRTALVLVPEIALTPQMVQRFKGRLGEEVAVLHSQLGLGERYDQWRGIREGRYRVVIGARSALFAPLKNLGLIILDEEHENTYKEGSPPRYHAREVARERARLSGAVLVLGSATPSLESLYASRRGESLRLLLPHRVDHRELPKVELVDMRELKEDGAGGIISPRLLNALVQVHKSGEQAILFLNRRGFARFLQCHRCGFIFRCSRCSVSLCYHSREPHLLCHHCNWSLRPPFLCPQCGNQVHRYAGIGTERVEAELRRLIPTLSCVRMDADTTARKDAHWDILESFREGRAQVLLGTQMIAKGLDMPNVTLVGVINADTSLAFPDFRAGERTFQLLVQVSGRAGRGDLPGRVIVQTFNPEHYAIRAAIRGDQESFYRQELAFRREALYPPFCHLVNLVVTATEEIPARTAAEVLGETLRKRLDKEGISVLGPAPAPLARIKGRYRFHLTLKTTSLDSTYEELSQVVDSFDSFRKSYTRSLGVPREALSLAVDVDPVTLL